MRISLFVFGCIFSLVFVRMEGCLIFTVAIKYIFMILCCVYTIHRLLNEHPPSKLSQILSLSIFTITGAALICILRSIAPAVSLIVLAAVTVVYFQHYFPAKANTILVAVISGFAFSYISFFIGVAVLAIMQEVFPALRTIPPLIQAGLIGVAQLLLAFLFFKIRRFSHGLPFLTDSKYGDIGVYLSVSILLMASFLGMGPEINQISVMIMFSVFLFGLLLLFWYKSRITQDYHARLNCREMDEMRKEVDTLRKENEILSAIVHRDNKFIPALDLCVKEFLVSTAKNDDLVGRMECAKAMVAQIDALSQERAGVVRDYENDAGHLAKTGSPIIDAVVSIMRYRAKEKGITIDVRVPCDVRQLIAAGVPDHDISTILAELTENALLSVTDNEGKRCVFIEMGVHEHSLFVSVGDNGPPFLPEILKTLGSRRNTSRKDSGGSGIGLMTVCNLCKKHHASFYIRVLHGDIDYSKAITVLFDRQGSFSVDASKNKNATYADGFNVI